MRSFRYHRAADASAAVALVADEVPLIRSLTVAVLSELVEPAS